MKKKGLKKIILASGGTGGHLFPAEALAAILLEKADYHTKLYTDKRQYPLSSDNIALGKLPHKVLLAAGVAGKSLWSKLFAFIYLGLGVMQALGYMVIERPHLVIGFGGYSSLPAMLAAKLLGIKTMLHEQNAVLGRANRLCAMGASCLALSFPKTKAVRYKHQAICHWVGNPVRPNFQNLLDRPYHLPEGNEKICLLVTGGSQGASIFSTIMPKAIALLPQDIQSRLYLVQQARKDEVATLKKHYKRMKIEARIEHFFTNMPELLANAHLVLARSGASTIAELTPAGRPAILVPYPHAIDNHQMRNSEHIAEAAGGWVIEQHDFTPQWLSKKLQELLAGDGRTLLLSAKAMQQLAKPNAAQDLADLVTQTIDDAPKQDKVTPNATST